MAEKNQDFLKRLLVTFKLEAEEHLKQMTAGLLELEKTSIAENQTPIVENIFREAHSLKGAARAVSMTEIEELCQSVESVFAAWNRKELISSPELFDILHRVVQSLDSLVSSVDRQPGALPKLQIQELRENMETVLNAPSASIAQKAPGNQEQEPLEKTHSDPTRL